METKSVIVRAMRLFDSFLIRQVAMLAKQLNSRSLCDPRPIDKLMFILKQYNKTLDPLKEL